ncbi:hypothetical protein F4809DRAFT_663728 [Biscogniauxia mediterranea]|nr:hypothetical protein F4809DRAFT_663728 [Biscogniauxia mediterranea]
MSVATMTMTVPASTTTTKTSCCPNCGLSLPADFAESHSALLQARKQIDDLQAQVRLLNQKAAAAVDRWADYEDELSRLRAASTTSAATSNTNATSTGSASSNSNSNYRPQTPTPSGSSPRSSSFLPAGAASRISALLSPRRSANNNNNNNNHNHNNHNNNTLTPQLPLPPPFSSSSPSSPTPAPPPRPRTAAGGDEGAADLASALARERALRAAAEGRLHDTSREVEELSVTLFEQANEMVAAERRARAELEARVGVLERRDREKRDRLDRLEGAVGRIERVRRLLGEGKGEEQG